jgi:hypothetical protein
MKTWPYFLPRGRRGARCGRTPCWTHVVVLPLRARSTVVTVGAAAVGAAGAAVKTGITVVSPCITNVALSLPCRGALYRGSIELLSRRPSYDHFYIVQVLRCGWSWWTKDLAEYIWCTRYTCMIINQSQGRLCLKSERMMNPWLPKIYWQKSLLQFQIW